VDNGGLYPLRIIQESNINCGTETQFNDAGLEANTGYFYELYEKNSSDVIVYTNATIFTLS
jgi:hypothetical protein